MLEDASGREVAKIQERKLSVRDKVAIERDDRTSSRRCTRRWSGIRDRFAIDVEGGDDLKAHGNIVDHEYEIERPRRVPGAISSVPDGMASACWSG